MTLRSQLTMRWRRRRRTTGKVVHPEDRRQHGCVQKMRSDLQPANSSLFTAWRRAQDRCIEKRIGDTDSYAPARPVLEVDDDERGIENSGLQSVADAIRNERGTKTRSSERLWVWVISHSPTCSDSIGGGGITKVLRLATDDDRCAAAAVELICHAGRSVRPSVRRLVPVCLVCVSGTGWRPPPAPPICYQFRRAAHRRPGVGGI